MDAARAIGRLERSEPAGLAILGAASAACAFADWPVGKLMDDALTLVEPLIAAL